MPFVCSGVGESDREGVGGIEGELEGVLDGISVGEGVGSCEIRTLVPNASKPNC